MPTAACNTDDTRSTTTSVDCQEPAVVGQDRTCTVTVTDTQSACTMSDPAGPLALPSFPTRRSSDLAAGTCSLNGGVNTTDGISTCTVVYTPSAYGTGTHNIRASYPGSAVHSSSADSTIGRAHV